ncbi:bifunctional hydroxymethylpyrimidine kinase/phosphomethylpyrimidine kinase [Selenomonas sp. F0473]|uniref:bifunctional hydroxymethylpyrimidine kinase/phosphomethylpyrimidine kinase n=1 Tax=Selenomonas sp. F0473 TaxID=999423 RepID=UPI0025D05E04|nr:bifunctional hydroxymethylpyrimidine kinase/phosphomethylpyrimidine kinase [Selenomonas sp. F0473]
MKLHTALTIAGSDSGGGAGIQADLKTMTAHGVYGMTAVTALTAQNTTGVTDILAVPPAFLAAQIDAVFTDIPPDAVKIGMAADAALIRVIAEKLDAYGARHVVLDPVMVATSGARLISEDAVDTLRTELVPRADLITPNIPEAEVLADMGIKNTADMERAAAKIYGTYGTAVLMKGGHAVDDANDLLADRGGARWFRGRRIVTENTHGTGCTLSSAIASNLARGFDMYEAVARAKDYLSGALAAGLDLGKGHGPMAHGFDLKSRFISS